MTITIQRGSIDDLHQILAWLQQEYEEDGRGFWANRTIVERAVCEQYDLWSAVHDGNVIGFQVGNYAADIISVQKAWRLNGVGRTLFEASLQRAKRDAINVLEVECYPHSSLPFWQKLGFQIFHSSNRTTNINARYIIEKAHKLPLNAALANVEIDFFDGETGLTKSGAQYESPTRTQRVLGAFVDSKIIQLERRVIGLNDLMRTSDLHVSIIVNGQCHYSDKAKYDDAQRLGVQRDRVSGHFFIDRIQI